VDPQAPGKPLRQCHWNGIILARDEISQLGGPANHLSAGFRVGHHLALHGDIPMRGKARDPESQGEGPSRHVINLVAQPPRKPVELALHEIPSHVDVPLEQDPGKPASGLSQRNVVTTGWNQPLDGLAIRGAACLRLKLHLDPPHFDAVFHQELSEPGSPKRSASFQEKVITHGSFAAGADRIGPPLIKIFQELDHPARKVFTEAARVNEVLFLLGAIESIRKECDVRSHPGSLTVMVERRGLQEARPGRRGQGNLPVPSPVRKRPCPLQPCVSGAPHLP